MPGRRGGRHEIRIDLEERACETCGQVYRPRRVRQRFCGPLCRYRAARASRKATKNVTSVAFCDRRRV